MKKLLRIAAIAVMGVSLAAFGGGAAFADSATIEDTGPDSHNTVEFRGERELDVENDNDIRVENRTEQRAYSGDVTVRRNTSASGDHESGEARNDSLARTTVEIDNASNGCLCDGFGGSGDNEGTIENTGPDSRNHITFRNDVEVDVENDNEIDVENDTEQSASSGNVRVERNTTANGDARSGDAVNINTVETVVRVSN